MLIDIHMHLARYSTISCKDLLMHPAICDFNHETTKTVLQLIMYRIPIRYPDIKFILCHGADAMPYRNF